MICTQKTFYYLLTNKPCTTCNQDHVLLLTISNLGKIVTKSHLQDTSLLSESIISFFKFQGKIIIKSGLVTCNLLGETIGSKSLTIANYPITVPDYFDNYVFKYGGSFDNLNLVLQNAIDKAEDSNFISNYCLDYTFEDFCESKLNEIIKVGGNN